MSDSGQGGALGMVVVVAAIVVMVGGGVLLWKMLKEGDAAPRPDTPARYLKPSDSEANPPHKFSDEKVDEDKVIP